MTTKNISYEEKKQLVKALEARKEKAKYNRIDTFFPDEGPLRRELYVKHLEFFKAGAIHKERAFIASNRSGKTISGAYEMACHLTGIYPHWWEGRRFSKPVDCWVVGVTNEATRDIIQKELLGRKMEQGTGMVPGHLIERTTHRSLPADSVTDAYIKHSSGGLSVVGFKAANQGRLTFQGTAKDIVWCDEEVPEDIYSECLMRTMLTSNGAGMMMLTFTPVDNLTPLVLQFLPNGVPPVGGVIPD